MKLYGSDQSNLAQEDVVPSALAEVTLVASPAELRRIAEFLIAAAASMERMGHDYGHEHLSDRDHTFRSSPHLVIARPDDMLSNTSLERTRDR
jgi:hypothetical protein